MEDKKLTASLDYEAEYMRAMEELEMAKHEITYMSDELRQKKQELAWLRGFKAAVDIIFGEGGCNG